MIRSLFRSVAAAVSLLGMTAGTWAAVMSIPGVSFVPRDFGGETINGEATGGMLANADGRYYAPVLFPSAGKVCGFALVFRDVDAEEAITARLVRKSFVVGNDAFTGPAPFVMATVKTPGQADKTRRRAANKIKQPKIDLASSFYYVELEIPVQTLQVIGVQIDVRPNCN